MPLSLTNYPLVGYTSSRLARSLRVPGDAAHRVTGIMVSPFIPSSNAQREGASADGHS